jgi:protein JSN1
MPIGYSPSSESPTGNATPVDPPTSATSLRSPFGLAGSLNPSAKMSAATRSGAGSPSHEMGAASRIYSKSRAREIQAQEGVSGMPVNLWGGPPTSGNSTPLRENIPESPTDGFPDFSQALPTPESLPQTRRARAGTVPSRFSPGGIGNGLLGMPPLGAAPKAASSKPAPAPSPSPFKSPTHPLEPTDPPSSGNSTLLSRLRAGSMPQRSPFMAGTGTASPFGPSIFTNWNPAGTGRERGSTLASIASIGSNGPSSPAQSAFSKEGGGDTDVHMRTLDYLGLAETPQQPRAQLATPYMNVGDFSKASRFRSYSVNNKDKYADEDEEDYDDPALQYDAASMMNLQDQIAATQLAIRQHNMAVQAFQRQAMTRPRARTAGVLDTPGSRLMGTYLPGNPQIPSSLGAADAHIADEKEYEDLSQNVASLTLARSNSRNAGLLNPEESGLEGPTSALWLGSIPTSTTISTLQEMFKSYGNIISARVLTHKNCGFVNFERLESAVAARANLNGKEIFPGAGPVRINFAKPPSTSNTPSHDGVYPSPSPDPFAKSQEGAAQGGAGATASTPTDKAASPSQAGNSAPTVPPLRDMTNDILDIVKQFGASDEDRTRISNSLQSAINFESFVDEIPPIREPAHTRVHDAPKLRDIRKRIDNQSLSQAEIESIAVDMLPEIAELSSDYLGNTVVQKLFEHCSDQHRDAMLAEIAPHMAEIGVHKNGTWAAQKIIDVCKTPHQMSLIVEHLRPYTIPLFLDQYGNYVLQGCLKFGSPYNDFIFETMLSKMWEVAQGRYGARAMRACLESHHATKDQQRMLAAAIALHSVQLATNANGALLLTWFLDTCTFPQRRTVLSPHLVPYLVHLCTHKVAYLTVLKVINQKAEADARDTMLKALFFTPNDQVLEAILSDHACGATLIFKVITTPFFDDSLRGQIVETVKAVLLRIKAQPSQGYKRLMDEVGLSTRNNGGNRDHGSGNSNSNSNNNNSGSSSSNTPGEPRQRPASRQANNANGHHQPGHGNKQFYNGPINQGVNPPPNFDAYNAPRNDAMDPAMTPFQSYGGPQTPMYSSPGTPVANIQQYQYQQTIMNRGLPPVGNFFPPMQAGFGGYNSPSPSVEQFRSQNMTNGSPIQAPTPQMPPQMPGAQGFAPPGFGMGMNMGGFPYGNMPGAQNMGYVQQDQGGRRGGRR